MRLRSLLLIGVLCWLISSGASAGADINSAQRTEDKRLEAAVTVAETRVHVTELLSRLSAQTGVTLKTNPRLDASGITLMASLVRLPLADAMNALTSLVGCRSAKWYWERQGKPGSYTYWLQAPELREAAARRRARVQSEFEQQAATLMKAARMNAEQRKELMGRNKADDAAMADPRVMSGIKIFSETVPAELQQPLLRGEIKLKVPVSQLSPEGQAYVRSEYRKSGIVNEDPQTVFFNVDPIGMISPSLFMEIGKNGGYNYVGGVPLNNQFKEELASEWMLPGDALTDPLDAALITRPKDYKPTLVPDIDLMHADELPQKELAAYFARFTNIIQTRLAQMSQAAPVSLLAIVPATQQTIGEPYTQTVGHYVSALRQSVGLLSKWHDRVLLVNYGLWFLNMDACVPFDTSERLREQQRKGHGAFSLANLAAAADGLSERQLTTLAEEFPVFKSVASAPNIFALYRRFPEILSKDGIAVTPEMIHILNQAGGSYKPALAEGTRVRIREIVKDTPATAKSLIMFEQLDANGEAGDGLGIKQNY